jgi:hypothetical protein
MPELRLSHSLYDPQAVQAAVQDFVRLATVEVQASESESVVRLEDLHPHFGDRLVDELANHALALSVQLWRSRS